MIGTKRRNVSFTPSSDDTSSFQNKRAFGESPFGGGAAALPSLDRRRAARQHVRALNTEFASWVQSQLQDHPDELWEDGVKDYLTHASDILVKFSDVISWLKSNAGGEGSVQSVGTLSNEKNSHPEANSKGPNPFQTKVTFGSPATTSSLTPSLTGASTLQNSVPSTSASPTPSFSFGLSASSQAQSQSTSGSLATSWGTGMFSNSNSLPPVKSASLSVSPSSAVSSGSQAAPLVATASFTASTTSGLFPSTQTLPSGTTPSFNPWSSGAFSNSPTAFNFGNQTSSLSNSAGKVDADDDNEPEQPSSPSLKKSEEKGITVVHETKCKLYVKSTDPGDKEPWKDKGTGQLSIKCEEGASKGTKESKPRILIRNDVGKIMLNALIYPGIKTNLQKNSIVTIFHTTDDSGGDSSKTVARTFLIKTKNVEERNKLADVIRDYAPAV